MIFLPIGVVSIIDQLVKNNGIFYEIMLGMFTLIEIVLIIKGKYPDFFFPKLRILSGALFYALVNLVVNLIYFGLWKNGFL